MYGIPNACPVPSRATQLQMYWKSHTQTNSVLQKAAWMCGLLGDNSNPLKQEEIVEIAKSDKPYAWAYQSIIEGIERKKSIF